MKRISPLIALILFIPFLISQKPPLNGDKPYVEGEIMIKLYSDQPRSQQQMLQEVLANFQSIDLGMVEKLSDRLDIFLLSYNPSLVNDERLLKDIKAHPNVELAQFNHFIQQRALIPNDNFFDLQWALHNTGQTSGLPDADQDCPEGWDLGTSGVTASGDTIIIAIVDDGFDIDHEDLSFWKNYHDIPGNGIDDDTNGYIDDFHGWNAWSNNGTIIERDHGTHVSGIAAAKGNNGVGVSGVNWNVKVLPVVGSATVESIVIIGYAYVHEMRSTYNETGGAKGAFIVSTNSSFGVNQGDPADYPIWGAMYDSMGMTGILSAAATANANWNVDEVGDIPTAFPSEFLITVTNTDDEDLKNSSAAYGPTTIDLGAPGTIIYSTRQANSYGNKTGCSMSSPQVAGAVAYMFSVAGEDFMTACHNDPAGMALVIKQYILDGTDPLPTLDGITVTGGRLNIYNAAMEMLEPDITFNPLSLLMVLEPDEQDSIPLEFTNNSGSPVNYSITYPDAQSWLSLSGPISGTLSAFTTGDIMVHFDSDGIPSDTMFAYLSFNYNGEELFLVPVHLFVNTTFIPEVTVNIIADNDSVCPGESVQLSSDVTGGSGSYTYQWTSEPAGFTATGEMVSVAPEVNTTYYLQVSDESGNTGSDFIQITLRPLPGKPLITSGPASVDNYLPISSTYTCSEFADADSYVWYVFPTGAGSTSSTGLSAEISWAAGFTGSVQITVVGMNNCGIGEFSDAFNAEIYSSAGLDENNSELKLSIYPNPVAQVLSVKFSGFSSGMDYSLVIYDISGRQIKEIIIPDGQEDIQLNVEDFSQGIYTMVLKEGTEFRASGKFIINR